MDSTSQPETENVVSNGSETELLSLFFIVFSKKRTDLNSKLQAQKEKRDKDIDDFITHDGLTEKLDGNVDEKEEQVGKDQDDDHDQYSDHYYHHYSYQEEIDNFLYGTPDERAVDEYLDNHHNWMED
uniref:Uncharacterized protein n=1 Tax=Panagrolaimus davidi TaxID=227884 RepID=A0A914PA38_9BILA